MKDNQFDRFKRLFIQYLEEHETVCGYFIDKFRKIKTAEDFSRFVSRNADQISEYLDAEPDWDDCPRCGSKDREIHELEDRLSEIQDSLQGKTLEDHYKLKAIGEYYNEYNSQELEDLLKNGKEFLKSLASCG